VSSLDARGRLGPHASSDLAALDAALSAADWPVVQHLWRSGVTNAGVDRLLRLRSAFRRQGNPAMDGFHADDKARFARWLVQQGRLNEGAGTDAGPHATAATLAGFDLPGAAAPAGRAGGLGTAGPAAGPAMVWAGLGLAGLALAVGGLVFCGWARARRA
jgi:hypothetical protein